MMPKHAILAVLLTLSSLCGCYESVGVTWYEPGVYKGAHDPLLQRLKGDELNRQLTERVNQVQTDR